MENPPADAFALPGDQGPGGFVHHYQGRCVRLVHAIVAAGQPIARVHVQVRAVQQDRTVRRIVRPDARGGAQIQQPEDVGIRRTGLERRLVGRRHVPAFVPIRTVVAVGHAVQIQADHFISIGQRVHPVAFDGGRRADPGLGPVEVDVLRQLGHHQLPGEAAVGFVQAHQHAAVAFVFRVPRLAVVRPDQHLAPGHNGRRPALRPDRCRPFDVLARLGIEAVGQALLVRNHVPRVALTPLRLVGGGRGGQRGQ